jgi:4-amino-4-deoxy-L-arabinose transferase-like glycosyltransferase
MVTQAAVLLALAGRYGYHRDELYFRMLDPAWGYVDQPPLAPLLTQSTRLLLGDTVWALRLPAVAAAAVSVWLVAQITREVGGGRWAQALSSWAYAFASFPLLFGHTFLTNSLDAAFWLGILLCVLRARLREEDRWWTIAGLLTGLALYNKLLVVILLAALAGGLLLAGPRRLVVARPVLAGVGVALLVGLPNVLYQALHGWPQLEFGVALSANNSAEARILMWPMLLLMLGPPLAVVWVSGLVALWRRPAWVAVRFLAPGFLVLLGLSFLLGSQPTYPFAMVAALFAIGCVPTVDWCRRSRGRRGLVVAGVVGNGVVSALIALPIVPVGLLGRTPVPAINQVARDTVGWPEYVRQIAAVYAALPAEQRVSAVLVTSNYGEAGALDRYGPAYSLPPAFSGHNQLYDEGRPPDGADTVVFVGAQLATARDRFSECRIEARLDNGVHVENEEQGQPVAVCSGPVGGWAAAWPDFRHLD